MAEGIFRSLVADAGLDEQFEIDSAGTSNYHPGSSPDPRGIAEAAAHNIHLESVARQITEADLESFDYILVMDAENLRNVRHLAKNGQPHAQIRLLRDFDSKSPPESEVADPYYGGQENYKQAWEHIEAACNGLLEQIRATL